MSWHGDEDAAAVVGVDADSCASAVTQALFPGTVYLPEHFKKVRLVLCERLLIPVSCGR